MTMVVIPVHLASSEVVRAALLLGSGLLAVTATIVGLWLNRGADWRPWLLVVASESLLSLVNLAWLVATVRAAGRARRKPSCCRCRSAATWGCSPPA